MWVMMKWKRGLVTLYCCLATCGHESKKHVVVVVDVVVGADFGGTRELNNSRVHPKPPSLL